MSLNPAEMDRYDRQMLLPQVGLEGQQKLKDARVLLIGAGGLGSPVALYLAAAGVGTLGLVDHDEVDESNLQRQVLHSTPALGWPKTDSARNRLNALNPYVEVKLYTEALTSQNALDIMRDYHLVIDGTDNFPTRYLVNDACVFLGLPNVYGSVFRFEGQVSVFHPAGGGPCYRCLYPEPPPPGTAPSCAEGGVLGVLPGVIGTLQATEGVKFLLGAGENLIGRLLTFDALRLKFREMKVKRDTRCPVCGPEPSITELIDYQQFCGAAEEVPEISVDKLREKLQGAGSFRLIDVREPHEWTVRNLEEFGAELIPLKTLEEAVLTWDLNQEIVVHCKSGGRSRKAVARLVEIGFQAFSVTEGIDGWP
jgi:molybdopterin/thiamine biosynthesis adenylyltransferase/rhodanese-related sulfurtransferase